MNASVLAAALLLQLSGGSPSFIQPLIDEDARTAATRAATASFSDRLSAGVAESSPSPSWRAVTDVMVRANSGYSAPLNYRYSTTVTVDLDKDGRTDQADFVDNGKQGAIRIRFGNGRVRIFAKGKRRIYGEGLFAVGQHAIMVNYPESSIVFMFMHSDEMRAIFEGE